jgi:hypothetical protein
MSPTGSRGPALLGIAAALELRQTRGIVGLLCQMSWRSLQPPPAEEAFGVGHATIYSPQTSVTELPHICDNKLIDARDGGGRE